MKQFSGCLKVFSAWGITSGFKIVVLWFCCMNDIRATKSQKSFTQSSWRRTFLFLEIQYIIGDVVSLQIFIWKYLNSRSRGELWRHVSSAETWQHIFQRKCFGQRWSSKWSPSWQSIGTVNSMTNCLIQHYSTNSFVEYASRF